jgi:ABC-type transporter Mla MlaB component|tara:strand:- start:1656 stop:1928 length:273 start_codon:yes stop_codon:yes gene_type:complete
MEISQNKWVFTGDYTFAEIPDHIDQLNQISISQPITLDFSKLKNIDTSLLSFIFEIKRKANLSNQSVKLDKIPKNLLNLASLYGVENYLK